MQINLDIQNTIKATDLPDKESIIAWIKETLKQVGYTNKSVELTLRIVSEDESQQLNFDYRNKNSPTNILSFPFQPPEMIPASEFEGLLGDLVICYEVILREAKQQEKKVEQHWAHLIVHGVLHLLGYDHLVDQEAEIMEQLEVDILKQFKIADPYC